MTSNYSNPLRKRKLDPSFYDLEGGELSFFQKQTGIQDHNELKKHILEVQAKAYEIHGYSSIRGFSFLRLTICRIPGYQQALKLLNEQEDPIFLDFGCCFGNDARKAVEDGWPVQNVIASDLRKAFWDCGHELFRSTPETFPAAFIVGDAFDPAVIAPPYEPCLTSSSTRREPLPPLNTLTSFHSLRHCISAIHVSSLFHLFSETRQLELAKIVSSLLSPEKGSIIFGQHVALPEKGFREDRHISGDWKMFCHSPSSWKELWGEMVFGQVKVKVDAELIQVERKDLMPQGEGEDKFELWVMNWAVTRL